MLRRRRLDDERIAGATAQPRCTPSATILIAPTPCPAQIVHLDAETRQDETRQGTDDDDLPHRQPIPPPPPSNLFEAAAKALLLDEIRDEPAIMRMQKLFGDLSHQLTQIEMSVTKYNVSEDSPSAQKAKELVIDADLFSIGSLDSTDDESDARSSNCGKSTFNTNSTKDDVKTSFGAKDEDGVDKEQIIEIIDETDELNLDATFGSKSLAAKSSEQDHFDVEDICDEYKVFLGAAAPIKFAGSHR